MPEHVDPLRLPLQRHLDALTTQAGWRIDPDALDPTLSLFGPLVTALVDATARHAAATHLWHLLDGPLSFLLEVIGDGPIDTHDAELLQLTTLLQLRQRVREQREQAAQDLSDACDTLNAVGLTTPVTADIRPQQRGGRAGRDTAVLAALADVGFLAGLTEHRASTRSYETTVGGDTVHALLAVDGGFTLHSTSPDGSPSWQITTTGCVPAQLLDALIRTCANPDAEPIPATPTHPDRTGTTTDDPPPVADRTADSTETETTGEHPHGRLDV